MCSIIWSETFIKTNVYKTNQIENEDKMSMVIKKLREEDILISNVVIIKKRSKTQSVVIQATMEAAKWKARHTVFREVRQQEGVISVEEI